MRAHHLEQLRGVDGRYDSLVWLCEQYRTVALALGLRASGQVEVAVACIEPVLENLAQRLVRGSLAAEDWLEAMEREVARWCADRGQAMSADEPNDVLGARQGIEIARLPRIAKRRAVVQGLLQLERDELIAVLKRMYDSSGVDDIEPLLSYEREELITRLTAAEASLREALAQIAAS